MAALPTLDEVQDAFSRAQVVLMGLKEREKLLSEKEKRLPALDAEIQRKVDRHVVLDREHRELQENLVKLRTEQHREEQVLSETRAARVSEQAHLQEIRQELAALEQRFVRR